ncbi:1766_t:CDS:2 [Cetraspora pellucida]|uniref:1766_t:CDS:1 n=1 Tax=Cetraspora pellucida TaxID=1433469 RepID=A0A9N9E7Z5_9GLOM|nr:1766_t:CDS:2 [Cetraspora pellucida]
MEQCFETLRKTIQQLVDQMEPDEELEVKEGEVIFRYQDQEIHEGFGRTERRTKAQQIHDHLALFLQDLDQPMGTELAMPIEAAGETWSEKLSNVCSDIEDLNPRTLSTAEGASRATPGPQSGLSIENCKGDFSEAMLAEAGRLREEEIRRMVVSSQELTL